MDLRALVRAVLAPHDGVHGELARRRAAAQDVADPRVLLVRPPQLAIWLRRLRRLLRVLDAVDGHAATSLDSTEVKKARPSVVGPVSVSTACSGCGMRPTT